MNDSIAVSKTMKSDFEKNALFVAFSFPPIASAGVHRALRFVRFLPDHDWHTTILTAAPNAQSKLDLGLESLVPEGLEVNRVALVRPEEVIKDRMKSLMGRSRLSPHSDQAVEQQSGASGFQTNSEGASPSPSRRRSRFQLQRTRSQITELLFAIPDTRVGWKKNAVDCGLEIVRQSQPSVVYATGPPFSTLLVGQEIAKKSNLPLVLDFRDPWTRVPWGPRNKSWLANRWVAKLEEKCVRDAAAVILNTAELEQDFVTHYAHLPRDRFVSIPNGFDPEARLRVESYMDEAKSLPQDNKPFRLLHPGSLYRNRDPRQIIDAIAKVKQRGVHVVLEQVGFCDPGFDLENYAKAKGVGDRVEIHPAVPHEQMLRRMAEVDGFILLQPGTALQVPGKLFEMILFKKPILAICVPGAVSRIVNEFGIGTIAEDGSVDSIADAVCKMVGPIQLQPRWNDVASEFDGEHLTARLAKVFAKVTRNADARE